MTSSRLQNPVEFSCEFRVCGNMLQKINDDHPVEFIFFKRRFQARDAVDVVFDQIAYHFNCACIEVGAFPRSARAAQQKTDHPVVRTDIEASKPICGAEQPDDLAELLLFQRRLVKERECRLSIRQAFGPGTHG